MSLNILKYQYVAVLIHLGIYSWCIWNATHEPIDALSQAVWFPLFFIDLPASVILVLSWILVPRNAIKEVEIIFQGIFSTYPYMSFWNFWYLVLLYGFVGSVWWFYVPRIFMVIIRKIRP
jgi:hypothetical protein